MQIALPDVDEYTPPPSEYPAPEVSRPPYGLFGPRSPRPFFWDNGRLLAPPDHGKYNKYFVKDNLTYANSTTWSLWPLFALFILT